MWYVIQTVTGKEEELVQQIRLLVPEELYHDCFVIQAEWLKRLGGQWQINIRPFFPGYVFIDTEQPEGVFFCLKQVPKFSRLLGTDRFEFTPVEKEEQSYLQKLCGKMDHTDGYLVKLSTVETETDGSIRRITGPLKAFQNQIERIQLHKRFAIVRMTLCHRDQTILFGFRLERESSGE